MREVDLQRRQRDLVVFDGIEISACTGILRAAGGAYPVDGFAARRGRLDDRLPLVAFAETRDCDAAQILVRHVGYVDVE